MCTRGTCSQGGKGVGLTVLGCGMDEGGNIKDERIFPSKYIKQSTFCESPLLLRSEPAVVNYFLIKRNASLFCQLFEIIEIVLSAAHLSSAHTRVYEYVKSVLGRKIISVYQAISILITFALMN